MLLAVTRHPAMILYLDNHLSVRKGWQAQGLRASEGMSAGTRNEYRQEIIGFCIVGSAFVFFAGSH
jgi:uncharacterized protein (DUF1800 family)